MKPAELYAREPEKTNKDLQVLFTSRKNAIPEVIDDDLFMYSPQFEEWLARNERVEIRFYKDWAFDHRRGWQLTSVWFDSKPVMIIQRAGRENEDHFSFFITDSEVYKEMVIYLKELIPPQFKEEPQTVDPDVDIPNLTTFYGDTLDGYFGRRL